ncbi:MAG: hypothetical protein JXA42_09165 [Anaerolineales bacterium]|nr:hypothetical protein [Anaerolineales bacterium]
MKQALVVDSTAEAETCLKLVREGKLDLNDCMVVGLDPRIRAYMKNRGLSSESTVQFFDNQSHRKLAQVENRLISLFDKHLHFKTSDGLGSVYKNTLNLHANSVIVKNLRIIEILDGINRKQQISTLLAISGPASPKEYLSLLAPKWCSSRGVHLCQIPLLRLDSDAEKEKPQILNRVLGRIVSTTFGLLLARLANSRSILLTSEFAGLNADFAIQVCTPTLNVEPVALNYGRSGQAKEIVRSLVWLIKPLFPTWKQHRLINIPMLALPGDHGSETQVSVRAEILSGLASFWQAHGAHFSLHGVSFVDELQHGIAALAIPHIMELCRLAPIQAAILDRLCPSLVLSTASANAHHLLGKIASERQIPTMIIPVKSLKAPKNALENAEFQVGREIVTDDYDWVAAPSPLMINYLKASKYQGQIVQTGPLIWSKDVSKRREASRKRFFQNGITGKIVLYTTSARWTSNFHIMETLDETLSSIEDLLSVLGNVENLTVVIRLHPAGAIAPADLKTLIALPDNAVISFSRQRSSFGDVLALADVMVTCRSTTIEEAILNNVPVVLFDKWSRYNHLDAPVVQNGAPDHMAPAYYVDRLLNLRPTIEWVLAHHEGFPEPPAQSMAQFQIPSNQRQDFQSFVNEIFHHDGAAAGRRRRRGNTRDLLPP